MKMNMPSVAMMGSELSLIHIFKTTLFKYRFQADLLKTITVVASLPIATAHWTQMCIRDSLKADRLYMENRIEIQNAVTHMVQRLSLIHIFPGQRPAFRALPGWRATA